MKEGVNYDSIIKNDNEVIDINGKVINKDYKPENTTGVEIINIIKIYDEKEHPFTRKIFHLNDGKTHIIDFENC